MSSLERQIHALENSSSRISAHGRHGGMRGVIILLCLCAGFGLYNVVFTHTQLAALEHIFSSPDNYAFNDDDIKNELASANRKSTIPEEDDDDDDDTKTDSGNKESAIKNKDPEKSQQEEPSSTEQNRMNVLVLYVDDWRWDSIGEEDSIIQTPFLDSFAKDNIRFRQNAVTTSICWQSRATLFTGQWASRHRSFKLRCPHFTVGKAWNQTWAGMLRNDGYHLGHIGKWQYHNSDLGKFRFDWWSIFEGKHWYPFLGKQVSGEDLARIKTLQFLEERPKDKPFAATIAFYPPKPIGTSSLPGKQYEPKNETRAIYENITIPEPPHASTSFHQLPPFLQKGLAQMRWKERYSSSFHYQESMKNMYALITQIDQAMKEIVNEVKRLGLYDNTLIIITADNGMFNGAHGLAGKWYPYQESIRVPLIIHDPRMSTEKKGTVDENFTLNVDLAETILGAAGLKPNDRMQGRDISNLYLDNFDESGKTALEREPWRDEFFYEFTYMDEKNIPSSNALVRKKWKLIDWYAFNESQLFNLENDPLELNDVKSDPANLEIVREMKARLNEMRENLKEPDIGCETGPYLIDSEEATPK